MKGLEDRSDMSWSDEPRDYTFEKFSLRSRLLRKISSIASNAYFFGEAVGVIVSNYIGNKMKGFGK